MRLVSLVLLAVVLLSAVPGQAQEATDEPGQDRHSSFLPPEYVLVFGDEFDQTGLDLEQWKYRYSGPYLAGFNSEQSVIQPGDGSLHLVTTYDGGQFLTGMIESRRQFQYGYFEARLQFQSLQGHHGAFWLQSPLYGQYLNDPGRSGAEIDIIEFFGSGRSATDAQHNIHWNPYASDQKEKRSYDVFYRDQFGTELSDDFHVFGLLWTPEGYVFFIDGTETWRTSDGLSHTPEVVVLSLITSDWENARLDPNLLPDEMLIDYVRVYTPTSGKT